jgi:hypothetical protein
VNIGDLIPSGVKAALLNLIDKVEQLLQGETLRAIGYGGAVVVYLVAKAVGSIPDVPFEQAVTQAIAATGVIGAFVESARHFVYSPATAAGLKFEATEHQYWSEFWHALYQQAQDDLRAALVPDKLEPHSKEAASAPSETVPDGA